MSLKDWLRNGWLVEHRTSAAEIADLRGVIARDLRDCRAAGLGPDWRLAIAYNAAVQVAVTALAADGYRPAREQHHHRAVHSLNLTLGLDTATVSRLDAFRKKRSISDYERAGAVSDGEADEMIALAVRLRDELTRWLKRVHPELLGGA